MLQLSIAFISHTQNIWTFVVTLFINSIQYFSLACSLPGPGILTPWSLISQITTQNEVYSNTNWILF